MAQSSTVPVDGFQSLISGMQAGLDPELAGETAYCLGINLTSRGGLVRTRPGFVRGPQLPSGVFQGMRAWILHGASRIVAVISGHVIVVNVDTSVVADMGLKFDAAAPCCFVQADRYMVVMNGVDRPIALRENAGAVEFWPVPTKFPTGPIGEYVFGRVHLSPNEVPDPDATGALENGRPYFVSGNILQPLDPSSVLDFDETEYWNEGGANGLPLEMGYITGFASLRNASTGTGYGPLIVFAERGVSAFDVSVARSEWKNTGIAQVLFFGPGAVSPWAVLPVNGTIVYRAVDGLRILSYIASSAQSNEMLSNVVQSSEVGPYMRGDEAYFRRISMATVDSRVFVTAGGVDDVWFRGLVVLDNARVYNIASPKGEVGYDGAWQIMGRKIGGVASARYGLSEALFVYCDDGCLWRFDEDATSDNGTAVACRLVTRSMGLNLGPDRKTITLADLWIRGLTKSGQVTLRYRPTGFPFWGRSSTQTFLITTGSYPQKRHLVWSFPSNSTAPVDNGEQMFLNSGSSVQCAVDWEGPLTLSFFRLTFLVNPEGAVSPCGETTSRAVLPASNLEQLGEWL